MAPTKMTRMDRAKNERMYFMGRATAAGSAASFIVTGQSGKVWTVSIPRKGASAASSSSRTSRFHCNCPDNLIRKGTCKHMLFVCLRVLKISEEQLKGLEGGAELDVGFLHEVLHRVAPEVDEEYTAPAALKERLKSIAGDFESTGEVPKVEPRIPEEGDSCPICYDNLLDSTALVYCGYGCGKPVHSECFERYTKAQQQRFSRNEVSDDRLRCVTCRMDWNVEPATIVGTRGMLLGRRAINLAAEMPEQFEGISAAPSRRKRKATSSKKGSVKGGRVTKSAKASRFATRTKGERQSSRLAAQGGVANTEQTGSNSGRRRTSRKVTNSSKNAAADSVTPKRGRPRKTTPKNTKGNVSKKRSSHTGGSKWLDAVLDTDGTAAAKSTNSRKARAARRNSARLTRSMTA